MEGFKQSKQSIAVQSVAVNNTVKVVDPAEKLLREQTAKKEAFGEVLIDSVELRDNHIADSTTYAKASEKIDELIRIIAGITKKPENVAFVSSREMANRILRIIDVYKTDLMVIKKPIKVDPRIEIIDNLVSKCHNCLDGGIHEKDEEIEKMNSDILESNEDEEYIGLEPKVDATLNAETMKGVLSIDRWMLRHMYDTGIQSIWGENDKFAFVSHLLKLSARERLYMYYVIENGKRHDVKASDVVDSQLSYVPNQKVFADRMKVSCFRIFRRVAAGKIYWDKLSDAYSQLETVRPAIEKYSHIDQNKREKNQHVNNLILGKYLTENKDAKAEDIRKLELDIKNRDALVATRNGQLDALSAALKDFKNKKMKADSAWVNKEKKKTAANNAARTAMDALKELIITDSKIGKIECDIRDENVAELSDKVEGDDEEYSLLDDIADTNDKLVENVGSTFSAIHDPLIELEKESQYFGLAESSLGTISSINVSALSVLAAASMLSFCSAARALSQNRAGMMRGDFISATAELSSQLAGSLESAYTAATSIIEKINVFDEAVIEGLGTAAEYVGVATATVAFSVNLISLTNQSANRSYLKKADTAFTQKHTRDGSVVGESEEDKKARLRREKFEKNMVKLQQRTLSDQSKSTAIDMVSNVALGVASLSGGLLAGAATAVSVGACIYSTIRDSIVSRKRKRQSVDDYLGIAEYNSTILNKAFENYIEHPKNTFGGKSAKVKYNEMNAEEKRKFEITKKDALRENIRNEIMAKMGCSSKSACYNMIMEKYAQVLFDGAFMDGDSQITDLDRLNEEDRKPYADYIRSLGLKIKKSKDGSTILPTQKSIATKLAG